MSTCNNNADVGLVWMNFIPFQSSWAHFGHKISGYTQRIFSDAVVFATGGAPRARARVFVKKPFPVRRVVPQLRHDGRDAWHVFTSANLV